MDYSRSGESTQLQIVKQLELLNDIHIAPKDWRHWKQRGCEK